MNSSSSVSSSSDATLLQGLLLGFFFPLIPLFFMRESRPAVFWEDGSAQDRPSSAVFSCVVFSCLARA